MNPEPRRWLANEDRLKRLSDEFSSSRNTLLQAGLYRPAVIYWVRKEVSLEFEWSSVEEENKILDSLEEQWVSSNSGPKPSYLREKLRVKPASISWAKSQWSNQLETFYLQQKDSLDQASCYFLKVPSKNLSIEIYHRIKAGEESFDSAEFFLRQSCRNLHRQNTYLSLRPISKMPLGLDRLIRHLSVDQVSQPLRIGDQFCIVQLEALQEAVFDEATKNYLIAEHFRSWLDLVADTVFENLVTDQ